MEFGRIRFRLKNDNEAETTIRRYQHFRSETPFLQKRATLTAALRRVQRMSSDADCMSTGAGHKIAEFRRLRYPLSVIRQACSFLAATTAEPTWICVRDALRET